MISHLLTFLERDSSSVLEICLVSHQDSGNVILSVLLDFAHPGVDRVEGVTVGDVVHDNNSVSALVVAGSDGLETLLAGSVPDLQLADLLVDVDGANLEVDSDCWHKVLLEVVISDSAKHNKHQLM